MNHRRPSAAAGTTTITRAFRLATSLLVSSLVAVGIAATQQTPASAHIAAAATHRTGSTPLAAGIDTAPGTAGAVASARQGPCEIIAFDSGELYPWSPTGFFQGWCDGRGPQSYRAWVGCSDGHTYYGEWRWFGDRRGSTAWCPTNLKADFNLSGVSG